MKRIIGLAMAAIFINGCATPYAPSGFAGGFTETQLDRNVFRVSFQGNGYTARDQVEEMALLRSAELTLEKGYAYFVIIENNSRSSSGAFTTPLTATTTTLSNGMATTAFAGAQTFNVSIPATTKLIMCLNERPQSGFSYDAKFLTESLSKKYKK